MPDRPRYEDDFYAWAQYQAEVPRSMPAPDSRFHREHLQRDAEVNCNTLYADGRKRAAVGLRRHDKEDAAEHLPAASPWPPTISAEHRYPARFER